MADKEILTSLDKEDVSRISFFAAIESSNQSTDLLENKKKEYFKLHEVLYMLNIDLKNKVILVTGSTSGIGAETAILLSNYGASIIVCGRNEKRGEAILKTIQTANNNCIFVKTDITSKDSLSNLFRHVQDRYNRLDIAINNAGIEGNKSSFHLDDDSNWNDVINTNLNGLRNCLKFEITQMLRQEKGKIINMSSIAGLYGNNMKLSPYVASKHAVIGLTKALALEYADNNIVINAICPGFTDTPMLDRITKNKEIAKQHLSLLQPTKNLGTAENIAALIAFMCCDEASHITGTTITIDGGATTS